MKEWMNENWTEDYNVMRMGTVDIWLWSIIPTIKKILLTVPPTSWSEWQVMLQKLIGIRIILVHSLNNASVCQSPCHIYKHLSSPNVQNLSENQMEQKHNSLSFKELYNNWRNSFIWICRDFVISNIVLLRTLESNCWARIPCKETCLLLKLPQLKLSTLQLGLMYIKTNELHLSRNYVLYLTLTFPIFWTH